MKKILVMLLNAVMLLALVACGQNAENITPPPSSEQTEVPVQETDAPTPSVDNGVNIVFDPSATIEETVLVDESDIKITVTGAKYTAYSVKLELSIENNSDKNLSFRAGTLGYGCNSVNGYMVDDGYLNVDVSAGKKANETISFDAAELTMLGITDIADIELGFSITDDQYNDYLQTGSRQIRTSIADSYDYAADTYRQAITDSGLATLLGFSIDCDTEEGSFDQKGVRILSQTLITNSSGNQALFIEVENSSSDIVYVSVGDVSINGLGVQSGTWSTDWVSPGKRRVISLGLLSMLDDTYREPFGLNEIGSVAYSLEIMDIDRDTLAIPQQITLSVPGKDNAYDASGEELYWENGIRIVSKGLVEDSFEYSDDIHILFLVENGSSEQFRFDVDYDSVSVNGYMTDFICYSRQVTPGGSVILDVELMESSLEKNGITGLEDITEIELTFEIKNDSYKTVAEPVIIFSVK